MVSVAQRLRFSKTGRLKFISHLDLCRTMKSAFLRAGIPIFYSEGFNPHPKMVFALTLSVGAESVCELLDIKTVEPIKQAELKRRLNAALTDELVIQEVYTPQTKFTDIAYSEYDLVYEDDFDVSPLDAPEIIIEKQTKSGTKNVDIKPLIQSYSKNGNTLTLTLDASGENYLNPEYVASLIPGEHTVMRKRILTADLTDFR